MNELALNLPWQSGTASINNSATGVGNNFGSVVSGFGNIAFLIGGFLMLFWLSWGVFQYIFAGGDKEKLARARARLTWAIIGFIILIISFFVSSYTKTFFPQSLPSGVTPVTNPGTGTTNACTPALFADCDRAIPGNVCKVVGGLPQCVAP